jgi:hypothetical protein
VLARQGDLILLSAIDGRGLLEKLLDVLAKTSEGGGDGRRFADAVENLIESDETWGGGPEGQPGPAVIAVGPVGAGLAVTVSGTAWAEVTTAHGTDRLAAGQPATVLRCVVGVPVHAVRGGLGPSRGAGDRTDRFSRLERGTVRAGGLSYYRGLPAPPAAAPWQGEAPEAVAPAAAAPAAVAPEAAAPPAHDVTPPDWIGPDPAAGAAAPAPPVEEGARAGEWSYPAEPPAAQPDAAQPYEAGPYEAGPYEAGPYEAGPYEAGPYEAGPYEAGPYEAGPEAGPEAAEPETTEPEMAESGMAEPGTAEPAAVEPAELPQAGPVRPATEKAQIPDFGAAQVAQPSGAAMPDRQSTSPAEVPPLPVADTPSDGTGAAADSGAPIVLGVYCTNGHFGDPNTRSCAVCGVSRNRRGPAPEPGPRPPLGALVLDDDSALELSADCVVGREPTLDPSVAAGEARPLSIIDAAVSRVHARVHLDGWRVFLIDLGSANGTRIQLPGKRSDKALEPNVPVQLQDGTEVFVGTQSFRYESRRGR